MKDFRRRNLVVLGLAALVFVAASAGVLGLRAAQSGAHFVEAPFLPGFAANVKSAARIHIVTHTANFDIAYSPGKGWVLPGKGNYPADFDQVRHALIGLAALEAIAPKTARTDWLSYIGLDAPPKGNGTEITVSDAGGHPLAALIMGNSESLGDGGGDNGGTGIFVRRAGQTQSYLARAVYVPPAELSQWLMQGVMNINAARLHDVIVTPPTGAAFTISRAHQSDQAYGLSGAPANGFNQEAVDDVADAIVNFSIADVRPVGDVDFTKAAHVTAHTFDGLTVNFDLVRRPDGVWARISAADAPGSVTGPRQEAQGISARAARWAYKMAPEKGQALMASRSELLSTPPAGNPASGGNG